METTTKELIEKLEAFKKAWFALSAGWTDSSEEDNQKLNNGFYPFALSFDEHEQGVKEWVDKSIKDLSINNHRYNTVFGYHNPDRSKGYFDAIIKALPNIPLEDTSWHNDTCDSVSNEKVKIYFPNVEEVPTNEDEENFNVYHLPSDETMETPIVCKTIEEVINVLIAIDQDENFNVFEFLKHNPNK